MNRLKNRKNILIVLLSVILTLPMVNLNAMDRVANVFKFTIPCIGPMALKLLKGTLVLAPYTKGIISLAGLAMGDSILRNSEEVKSLSEVLQDHSFQSIAPRVLDIAKKLELNPTAIHAVHVFSIGGHPSVLPTLKGPIIMLDGLDNIDNSDDEQRIFATGHELTHIKDHFAIKALYASWGIPLALDVTCLAMNLLVKKNNRIQSLLYALRLPLVLLTMRSISRYFEKHADIMSAKLGQCAQGGVQFFKQMMPQYEDMAYRMKKRSWWERLTFAVFHFLDGHPPIAERIKYLEPIAQEQVAH